MCSLYPQSLVGPSNGWSLSHNGDKSRADGIESYHSAIEASRLGFWDWNVQSGAVWLSPRCGEILGVGPGALPSTLRDLLSLITPGDPEFAQRELTRHLLEGGGYDQVHYAAGIGRWLRLQGQARYSGGGALGHASGSVEDVTDSRVRMDATVAIVESLLQRVAVVNAAGEIAQINRAWAQAAFECGADPDAVGVGCNYVEVCRRAARAGCEDAARMLQGLAWVMDRVRDQFEMEYECTGPDGRRRYFLGRVTPFRGDLEGVVVAHDEITDRKRLEKALRLQQITDGLTGLPNRQAFLERLARLHEGASIRPFCLLLADIDDLKMVNDTWSHTVGDRILVKVGGMLSASAGEHFLARVGSDEFALLIEGTDTDEIKKSAVDIAQKMISGLGSSIPVSGAEEGVRVRVSIGIALSRGSRGPDAVESAADLALQVSKRSGGSRIVFDDGVEVGKLLGRYARLREFGSALEHDRLRLDFQPIVEAADFSPHGVEALLRWVSLDGATFAAGRFMPAIVGTSAETEVDRWVIREACRQWAAWLGEHRGAWPLKVLTINVSRKSLSCAEFPDWYGSALSEFGVSGASVALEITEGGVDGGTDELIANCQRIERDLGTQLWLDDIGKAYSSLEWLCEMSGSVGKIDPLYLKKFTSWSDKRRVARSMVQLVKALEGRLVAECVETRDDVDLWREAGCDLLQGYFFAKPMRADLLTEWLFRKR